MILETNNFTARVATSLTNLFRSRQSKHDSEKNRTVRTGVLKTVDFSRLCILHGL